MRNFIANIKKSIWGRDYVSDFGDKTFWQGSLYLFYILLVKAVVVVGISFILFLPVINDSIDSNTVRSIVEKYVPAEATVIINNGQISTGDGEPIIIPLDDVTKNLLVIDASVENPLQSIEDYDTLVLATEDKLIIREGEGELKVLDVDQLPDFVVTREGIISAYTKVQPYIQIGSYILLPIIMISFAIVFTIFSWFISLFLALIILWIGRIKDIELTFKQSYVITLYALTLPILISILLGAFSGNPGFISTALIVAILVVFNLKKG